MNIIVMTFCLIGCIVCLIIGSIFGIIISNKMKKDGSHSYKEILESEISKAKYEIQQKQLIIENLKDQNRILISCIENYDLQLYIQEITEKNEQLQRYNDLLQKNDFDNWDFP